MKKSLLLHIRLSLAVVGVALFSFIFPTNTNAQFVPLDPLTPCSANWWARCCKCDSGCVVVDPLPSFGYCRECKLLCSGCRKELGDLNKALADLKQLNQVLYARYRAREKSSLEHNGKMKDAMVKTYGEESGGWNKPSTWNLSGLNSSFGKFTVAGGNLAANFGGGLGYTMLFNSLATLQSSNLLELEGNISSTIVDLLTDEGIIKFTTMDADLNKSAWKLYDAFRRGQPMDQAVKFFNQDINKLKGGGVHNFGSLVDIIADLYGFVSTGTDLISDLTDIYDNYKAREADEKERERLQEEILKNVDLMLCIKETQDSLKTGPLGLKRRIQKANSFYASKLLVSFFLSEILNNSSSNFKATRASEDTYFWQIDSVKIKLAISRLKQQDALLKIMENIFINEVIPLMIPWVLNKPQELKPATRLQLLKRLKASLNKLINNHKTIKDLTESITENVTGAILGYETNYSIGSPDIITSAENANDKKWELSSNEKIKGEMGRVSMSFPASVDWSFDFYTPENKFVTNRSSFSKHQPFYDITPGNYNIKLNHVKVENVPVEKGKEIKLKSGLLNLVTRKPWELYNESKEKYYTSGIKPVKFALPAGTYQLMFEGKFYRVIIKEGVTVKFESPIPGMTD